MKILKISCMLCLIILSAICAIAQPSVLTAKNSQTSRYGYFEARNGANQRGLYFGWGNGNDIAQLTLDRANKLYVTGGDTYIGGAENRRLFVRAINGKRGNSIAPDNLFFNYNTGKHVFVGNWSSTSFKSNLYVNNDLFVKRTLQTPELKFNRGSLTTSLTMYREILSNYHNYRHILTSNGCTVLALKPRTSAINGTYQNSNLELYDRQGDRFVIGHNSIKNRLRFSYKSASGYSPGPSMDLTSEGHVAIGKNLRFNDIDPNKKYLSMKMQALQGKDVFKIGVEDAAEDFHLFQIGLDKKTISIGGNEDSNTYLYGELLIKANPDNSDIVMNDQDYFDYRSTCEIKQSELDFYNRADYVFEEDYKLKNLEELEAFIKRNKHLPGVKSAEEIARFGFNVMEENNVLLEKVEELTLYTIEQEKKLQQQELAIKKLASTLDIVVSNLKTVNKNKQ